MSEHQRRFQALLRELFQFDSADLDFGIYRIMNHKRDVIERYITEDLPKTITDELSRGMLAEQERLAEHVARAQNDIREKIGDDALDSDGNLQPVFHETRIGAAYLNLRSRQMATGPTSEEGGPLQATIYNHLYNFFSRYYDDGDFISKRRYSQRERYTIPYNGEEVHLHWANKDQYYIKAGEHFRTYGFKAADIKVRFVVADANVEQGDVKGEKRYFFPRLENAAWRENECVLDIPFEYRPSTAADTAEGGNNLQEAIIAQAAEDLPKHLDAVPLAALVAERHRNGDGPVTTFEYHLRRYTRRNTTDFFIHRDLNGFLTREFDFYLKNEVLNLDGVETTDEITAERWAQDRIQTLRLMRAAAGQVIDFLDQAESFQKRIWEKRKFVTDVQYCIPVGSIGEEFYGEIAMCDDQWAEWQRDYGLDFDLEDMNQSQDTQADRIRTLRGHPTLVLDTKHFATPFTDSLLATVEDMSQGPTGLLFHSDNWQALNLIARTHGNAVDCIYIDPPYNTSASEIIYKNGYRQSSWMTLMANRVAAATQLLKVNAAWVAAIDDTEMTTLSQVIESVCPMYDRNVVVVNHHPAGSGLEGSNISSTHEYALFFTPEGRKILRGALKDDHSVSEIGFMRTGTEDSNLRSGRPNSFYAVLVDRNESKVVGVEAPPEGNEYPVEDTEDGHARLYPVGGNGVERVWRRSYKTVEQCIERGEIVCKNGRSLYLVTRQEGKRKPVFSNWIDSRFNAGVHGSNVLTDLFGVANTFPYPKSIYTVRDCIDACTHYLQDGVVLDYFAGSGTTAHAVMALNEEDGGTRSFVLVEVGDYFHTVTLPRIKKVMFAPRWKAGRPVASLDGQERRALPRIVKYMRLESYEDALNNIEFAEAGVQRAMELEDYIIKYMFNWETRDSATLLNVEQLSTPFDYKLTTHANGNGSTERADVAETFNYLLGLRVRTRKVTYDDERKYVVYRGTADGEEVVVVWRETAGWEPEDYRRDQQFLDAQKIAEGTDVVYANGVCFLAGAKALEPLFKERMFAPLT